MSTETYIFESPFNGPGYYRHTDGSVAWYFRNPSGQIERGRVFPSYAAQELGLGL